MTVSVVHSSFIALTREQAVVAMMDARFAADKASDRASAALAADLRDALDKLDALDVANSGMPAAAVKSGCDAWEHDELLPVADVAPIVDVGDRRVRQLCEAGAFDGAVKTGRQWWIPRSSVDDYLKGR